MQIMLLSFIRS